MKHPRAPHLFLSVALGFAACTSWKSHTVHGPPREVARRLVGAPQVAETSSASASAGFAGATRTTPGGTGLASAGLSGETSSIKRTHCVQQAEIDWVQPYEVRHQVSGRGWDLAGGIILSILGLSVLSTADNPARDIDDSHTEAYVTGGIMLGGGIGWMVYSYSSLPGPRPTSEAGERAYTTVDFVEATGCGLVPSDRMAPAAPAAPASGDIEARLEKLQRLHDSGMLTDEEYEAKRKELLDQL